MLYAIYDVSDVMKREANRPLSKIPYHSMFVPPKFCIGIAFIFSWDHSKSQEKMEAMFLQPIIITEISHLDLL